jgi:hypothetical protein
MPHETESERSMAASRIQEPLTTTNIHLIGNKQRLTKQ